MAAAAKSQMHTALIVGRALVSLSHARRHILHGRTILQLIPELEAGGAERTTIDIAEALAALGARALVATEGGRLVGELQAKGGEWLPFPAASKNPARMVLNANTLARLIRRQKVDVVHARSRAPRLGRARRDTHDAHAVPHDYHGSYSGQSAPKVLYNSVMARGDVVIANSAYTAELIRRQHPFAAGRIRVIHAGRTSRPSTPPPSSRRACWRSARAGASARTSGSSCILPA